MAELPRSKQPSSAEFRGYRWSVPAKPYLLECDEQRGTVVEMTGLAELPLPVLQVTGDRTLKRAAPLFCD